MDGGKKSRNPNKTPADYRSDRKSATGMSGDPKKGGRGGKFTWEGADGYADEDLGRISKNGNGKGNSNTGRAGKGGAPVKKDDNEEDE